MLLDLGTFLSSSCAGEGSKIGAWKLEQAACPLAQASELCLKIGNSTPVERDALFPCSLSFEQLVSGQRRNRRYLYIYLRAVFPRREEGRNLCRNTELVMQLEISIGPGEELGSLTTSITHRPFPGCLGAPPFPLLKRPVHTADQKEGWGPAQNPSWQVCYVLSSLVSQFSNSQPWGVCPFYTCWYTSLPASPSALRKMKTY